MNHIIKGIVIVVAITSMLAMGATTMIPIFLQGSAQTIPAHLTIREQCSPSCPPTIHVTVKGNNPKPSSFSLSGNGEYQGVTLGPGPYAVSVGSTLGYDTIPPGDCSGTAGNESDYECNISLDLQ